MNHSLRYQWRKLVNHIVIGTLFLLSLAAGAAFFFIVYYVTKQGLGAINLDFFTELPKPAGESGGGMANALIGSSLIVGLASLVGVPWGIAMGVYLTEYHYTRTAKILRFTADLLMSAPSIVIGIFIYGLVVRKYGFSSYAGSMALLLIMLPIVTRGTEEILKMIPNHIREAGLALGLPRWKTIVYILIPGSFSMILTIVMLAVARIAGETAPLLFTSLGNQFHINSLNEPTASLPVQIYEFSKSGIEQMEQQAWAGAMVLVLFIFVINLFTRVSLFFYAKK